MVPYKHFECFHAYPFSLFMFRRWDSDGDIYDLKVIVFCIMVILSHSEPFKGHVCLESGTKLSNLCCANKNKSASNVLSMGCLFANTDPQT